MVLSSRTWCEDGLRRALDELVALRAMYGADEDDGPSADINDVAVEIAEDALRNNADAAPNSLSHVPALDATVRFGGGGATVRVALPPGYPARSRPMIVAECASRHRGSDASWRMQLAADDAVEASGWGDDIRAGVERVGDPGRSDPDQCASPSSSDDDDDGDGYEDEVQEDDEDGRGEECALSAVEAARQAFLDYLASIPPDEEREASFNTDESRRKRGRRLVWFIRQERKEAKEDRGGPPSCPWTASSSAGTRSVRGGGRNARVRRVRASVEKSGVVGDVRESGEEDDEEEFVGRRRSDRSAGFDAVGARLERTGG